MNAAILIADGFEDAEMVIVNDLLRRLDISVEIVSCSGSLNVKSYYLMNIEADKLLSDVEDCLYDAIIIPGGPSSTATLGNSEHVISFIQAHDRHGKYICPFCSAPVRILGLNGLLRERRYTCSGELWMQCQDGVYVNEDIIIDQNLISGKGLGVAFEFSLTIASFITGDSQRGEELATHIYLR